MRLAKKIFLAVSVLILMWGVGGCKENGPTDATQRSWTVSGKCYRVGSTEPIAGASVVCGGLSTTSGQDGAYTINGVLAGTQTLSAKKAGLLDYSGSIEITSDVTFNIFMGFKRTNVSGYVSNAVDGPIGGARVTLGNLIDVTDIAGRFEFLNVLQGTDTVRIVRAPYNSSSVAVTLDDDSLTIGIALSRDSTIIGATPGTLFVDQSRPTVYLPRFPYAEHIQIRSNGLDSLGRMVNGVECIPYVSFVFPQLLSDPHVTLVTASLELCTDSAHAPFDIEIYEVTRGVGPLALSYNNQPELGKLLSKIRIEGSLSPHYSMIVGTEVMNLLLSNFRTQGTPTQIAIKGGTVYPIRFFSYYGELNRPRLSFKVQY